MLSGSFAVPPLLVYGDFSGCDRDPTDDVAEYGGTPCDPSALDRWISEPITVAFLIIAFALFLVAVAVMHRGLSRPHYR